MAIADIAENPRRPIRGGTRGRVRRDVALCTIDGAAFSVMVGSGEQYLPAFVLALGMSQIASGLVATIPMLAGAILQLITPWGVARLRSYRNWVVITAAIQGASFLPLVVGAALGSVPGWLIFACATVYWACGLGGGPAWSTWMSLLIPTTVRARYFARRARICHFGVLAGLSFAAVVLKMSQSSSGIVRGGVTAFSVLFGIAFVTRSLSSFLLSRQSEPQPLPIEHRHVGPVELARRLLHGRDGRLIAYATAAGIALQVCQPFLTPYFLRSLKFQEYQYGVLLLAAFAGRIVLLDLFGGVAQRHGALRLLWIGAIGLVPSAVLPLLSDNLAYLCFAQFFGGAAVAAHELALFLMYLETIREDERTSLLTMFNLLNSLASVAGSLLGGFILIGTHARIDPMPGAYVALFLVGAAVRIIALAFLARIPRQEPSAHSELMPVAPQSSGTSLDHP